MKKVYIGIDTHKASNVIALAFKDMSIPCMRATAHPMNSIVEWFE